MSMKTKTDDMGLVYIGAFCLFIAFLCYIWYTSRIEIVYYGAKFSYFLLEPFYYIAPSFFNEWRNEAVSLALNSKTVTFNDFLTYINKVGLLYIWIPILLTIRGLKIAFEHKSNYTRRKITIDTLPWIMSKHSPAIIPTLYYGESHDLLLNDDPPEHKSALTPVEWVTNNNLLIDGILDKERALELFKCDLGNKIININELTAPEKALFTVFGARVLSDGRDLKKAQELLDKLNISCHTHTFKGKKGYPDLSITDKLFAKYANHSDVTNWLKKHKYSKTLLFGMHKAALNLGKLPSSNFRWLKGMDRGLWYALNTTGRKTPFIESTAVYTQALWEEYANESGFEIIEPVLDEAVEGLENYLIKVGLITANKDKEN